MQTWFNDTTFIWNVVVLPRMNTTQQVDILGEALADYYYQQEEIPLILHTSYGTPEDMPVDWFFRNEDDFPLLEQKALQHCRGKVLDIGSGAGSHALSLQQQGFEITALEVSPKACWVMSQRGLRQVHCTDYRQYAGPTFDTLLLLMNGIGLIGKLSALPDFLQHMKTLLKPGGQLLFDSSNIAYLYAGQPLPADHYYGEVSFRFEYRQQQGTWFDWVYIDQQTLMKEANRLGWQADVLYEDNQEQFLVRMQPA